MKDWVDPYLIKRVTSARKSAKKEIYFTINKKTGVIEDYSVETKEPDIPSSSHKQFIQEYIEEYERLEEFKKKRLICEYCGKKIDDDKFMMVCNPDFPTIMKKQIYFHSKGKCNPRHRFTNQRREIWLREYNYKAKKRKM